MSRFQRRNRLLPGDGGKRIEEFVEAMTAFEVVNEVAEGLQTQSRAVEALAPR